MSTAAKKKANNRKKKSKGLKGWISGHILALTITAIALVVICAGVAFFAFAPYTGDTRWVYVPRGSSDKALKDSLKNNLGISMGNRVYMLWSMIGGDISTSHGAYRIDDGTSAVRIARRISKGMQTPVPVAFNGVRTMERLAEKIAGSLDFEPEDFMHACLRVLPDSGFTEAQFPAAFIPDKYEFYWTAEPRTVVSRLLAERNRFWNSERTAKARDMGLSPTDVAIIASIVEEETAKADERPKVARLYINRLQKNMRLQADPTVKFAIGDFSLRRITGKHLSFHSPYNTYLVNGLPPGPIRVPERATLEAVLNAPQHDYIYMCAKEDFSGYHNFATDYATHQANARRYQAELNRRNIR